jgi:hypothetical protein
MPVTAAKSETLNAESLPAVEKPKHKLAELTTYELRDYRRELEKAIAFFDAQRPVPPARGALQARLDSVIGEQGDRVRIARA